MPSNETEIQKGFMDSADLSVPGGKSASNSRPSGVTSTVHANGYVVSRERNYKLRDGKRYEEFAEMLLNEPVIAAGVQAFLRVVKGTEWAVTPIEGDADSARYAEAIEEVMDNLESGWGKVVQRSATFVFQGFSIQEWTARLLDSGVIGFKDVQPRSQHTIERWEIQDDGEITGITQRNPNDGDEIYIERRRLVYCVEDSLTDEPTGLGIFRQLYACYDRMQKYKIIEEIGFDNDLHGMPVVRVPLDELNQAVDNGSMKAEERDAIIDIYKGFLRNHTKKKSQGMMVNSEPYKSADQTPTDIPKYDIDVVTVDSSSVMDSLQKAISRERNNMAMLLSTGFLLLGEDGAGSLALSQTKIEAFFLFITSTLDDLAFCLRRDLFRPLAKLNGWDESKLPFLNFEKPKAENILEATEALRNMATAFGPMPSAPELINKILSSLGLPEISEEDFEEIDIDLVPGNRGAGVTDMDADLDPAENEEELNGDD